MLKWLSTTPNKGQTQTKTSNPNHKDEDTLAEHSARVSLDEQVPLTENSEEIGRDSSASEKVKFLAEANQPRNIKFLRHSAGKQNRSFQPAWFDKFPRLHYDEQSDSVCFTCIKALHLKMISSRKGEAAFTETGFRNWKNGLARNKGFHKHESSCSNSILVTLFSMSFITCTYIFLCVIAITFHTHALPSYHANINVRHSI